MIINTRPLEYQSDLLRDLGCGAGDIVTCPVLKSNALQWSEGVLDEADALIVTSQIAVGILSRIANISDLPLYTVGPGTAKAARQAGFSKTIEGGGTAKRLLEVLDRESFLSALYVSARHVSCDLALERSNRITRHVVYDMVAAQTLPDTVVDVLRSDVPATVPFYSPRSLQVFETLLKIHDLEDKASNATAVMIHPRLSKVMALPWGQTRTATEPNGDGMIRAILRAIIPSARVAA